MIAAMSDVATRCLGRGDATITVPSPRWRAEKPNQSLEKAETTSARCDAPEDLASDGTQRAVHRRRPRACRP